MSGFFRAMPRTRNLLISVSMGGQEWTESERQARIAGVDLWGDPGSVPPWKWMETTKIRQCHPPPR